MTVNLAGHPVSLDLELPAGVPVGRLGPQIVSLLLPDRTCPPGSVHLEAQPLGRLLWPDETLAQAGVWDGSWLVIYL